MGRKVKYTAEQKIYACESYLTGVKSAIELSKELMMGKRGDDIIYNWIKLYEQNGKEIFMPKAHNSSYSKELKMMIVQEYNAGSSLIELSSKYGIPSMETIRQWILKYNRHEELEDYSPKPEVYKMSARKTTLEERIEIVNWCLSHDKNYKEAAVEFNCSYTQVYQWVNKYLSDGESSLADRRGKRKVQEELSENERLNREISKLTAEKELLERENKLLKKLNALDWK